MPPSFAGKWLLLIAWWPLAGCGSLVFLPARYPEGDWRQPHADFEDAWFHSADGVRLHGWFAEARRPRAVVLYAHGNAGNVTGLRPLPGLFRDELNASLLVFDYRGYGRSVGAPDEKGVLADARAARRWLAGRAGIPEHDVVLLGRSLGGGVAVDLAARDGARGLILENTFTCIADVAERHAGGLPIRWFLSTRLDSLALIRDYHGPLLQTHGDADRTIPFDLAEKLFAAANEPKQFVRIAGGGHNDPPGREYLQALDRFLSALPPDEAHAKALARPLQAESLPDNLRTP